MTSAIDEPVKSLPEPFPSTIPIRRRRSRIHQLLHWFRRLHLYLGLFLFPWAILYGVTGFLFNHPLVLSDQPIEAFGPDAWRGTAMAGVPTVRETAEAVVLSMKERHGEAAQDLLLIITEPIRYSRDFAFANVKTNSVEIGLLIDPLGSGGTIRKTAPIPPPSETAIFPLAIGVPSAPRAGRGSGGNAPNSSDDNHLSLSDSLAERIKSSIPLLLKSQGLPEGDATVTSVPDLVFVVETNGRRWRTSYNALSGSVGGKPFDAPAEPLSWRRFLTRLHLAHGYPLSSTGARWLWAVMVDAMAFVMVYWGGSGLLMWWQIKATRRLGIGLLILSAVVAGLLSLGMYQVLQLA